MAALPPLWGDLVRAMEIRMGSAHNRYRDPLRTAEEFKAILGLPALEGLIRELVPDEQWLPGALHKKLVALPWVDILTTNWDTLLERAASTTLGQNFETVRCLEDIATARVPRIVKLHGSLPSNRPFILSEEEYRTYPCKFAPFVNLVQQVLLENELCLLGFSGDDPNFLRWTSWIRDHLGASARRIHIVGALHLSAAQRRLLEQRNISAIDLSPLVAHLEPAKRHQAATETFLDHLCAARPRAAWDWNTHHTMTTASQDPRSPADQTAAALKLLGEEWTSARLLYPGWAVCPHDVRDELVRNTVNALTNAKALLLMETKDRGRIVFEAAWRMDIAFVPIGTWAKAIEEAVADVACWDNLAHRDFIMALLLRSAREGRDEAVFQRWSAELETRANANPEVMPALVYERCLWARDGLDFTELAKLAPTLRGTDVLWSLRRAALYCDLGDFHTARQHIENALVETRGLFLRDRSSIWALSRLAWAQFCGRQLQEWNEPDGEASDDAKTLRLAFHQTRCDPWDTLSALDDEIESSLRRLANSSRSIEPRFDAGSYRDHGTTIWMGSPLGLVNYRIDRLSDSVGIPPRTKNTVVLSKRMEQGEPLTNYEDDGDFLRLIRIVHADGNEALERNFSRIQVANLAPERVAFLKALLSKSIDYSGTQLLRREGWSDQFWSRRAAAYTEILSRLLVRAEPAEALEWLRKGLAFAKDRCWQWNELFESLGHLVERALSSIPPSDIPQLLVEVMSFPLPCETSLVPHLYQSWPDSSRWVEDSLLRRPESDQRFTERVAALIEWVRTAEEKTRGRAALWLARLHMKGVLTEDENTRFGDALWSRRLSDGDLPSDTNLNSHMFVLLPSPDERRARELFKQRDRESSSADYLITIAGATGIRADGTRFQMFDSREALEKLNRLLAWQPKPERQFDLGQIATENKLARRALGAVIADGILPVLSPEELSSELVERIFDREADALSIVQSYPELLRLRPSEADRAVKGILRAMVSQDGDEAWAGFNALYRWIRSTSRGESSDVPRRLVEITISIIETRREPGLLHALLIARHLADNGMLGASDMERLVGALGLIFIESAYDAAINSRVIGITTLTLVRAASVRLAFTLNTCGVKHPDVEAWLTSASSDPMPEVRFAVSNTLRMNESES